MVDYMSNWENRTPTDVLSHLDEKCLLRRKSRSWVQFWMHLLFHTANKDLALRVSKVTVLQHQLINCFIIYRKSREDKTYKYLWYNSIINIVFSFSLHSQLNNAKVSPVPYRFVFSVNQCKRRAKYTSYGFNCTFPLQKTELLSIPLKILPSPCFQQSVLAFFPFPSKAACFLTQPCHGCFDLACSQSPVPSGNGRLSVLFPTSVVNGTSNKELWFFLDSERSIQSDISISHSQVN